MTSTSAPARRAATATARPVPPPRTDEDHVDLEVFDGKRCGINARLSAGADKTDDESCGCKLEKMSGHEGSSQIGSVQKTAEI